MVTFTALFIGGVAHKQTRPVTRPLPDIVHVHVIEHKETAVRFDYKYQEKVKFKTDVYELEDIKCSCGNIRRFYVWKERIG